MISLPPFLHDSLGFLARHRFLRLLLIIVGVFVLIALILYISLFQAPVSFPRGAVIPIGNGQSLSAIAQNLHDRHLIRSPFWFINAVLLFGREHQIVQGYYYFPDPENVFLMAWRLSHGDYQTGQIRTTIPDDSSAGQAALIIKKNYPSFDTVHFLTLAQSKEGYLYPDTYYFGATPTPESVISVMTANFARKINNASTSDAITTFGRPFSEVLTMASIVEKEALTQKDREIVAGILWKRLDTGIPLDVDATLYYITGRASAQLTKSDLANKSPYNTYVHKGLPPGPIGSPGLDAIMATLQPIKTQYLFFLSDANGVMHYAATLNGHLANQSKYIN